MKIDLVAGARPNFIKIAPIIKAIEKEKRRGQSITYRLIHTGQHYDKSMSDNIFRQLDMPDPDINLQAGGGTQAEQTAAIMIGYEKVLMNNPPNVVLVVGDVTSTLACSIVAKKSNIDVVHVEGGIRSGDMTMPEEINRIVTDSIADHFFTTSEVANKNLKATGVPADHIHFVGNTMIDTLVAFQNRFFPPKLWEENDLIDKQFLLLTMHRPANVDEVQKLTDTITEIIEHSGDHKIVFPVHPRTARILDKTQITNPRLICTEPLGYLEFNYLLQHAKGVITDSGGITEEASVLGIPCLTLRNNTERPETITIGTNELVGTDPANIKIHLSKLLNNHWKKGGIPPLWDGRTSERIVKKLLEAYS